MLGDALGGHMKKLVRGSVAGGLLAATALLGACTPASSTAQNWTFRATNVTVNSSQDAVYDPLFGLCVSFSGCSDEAYVLNVNFKVTIGGGAASASGWVTGDRANATSSLSDGNSAALTGAASSMATFSVVPVDLLEFAQGKKISVFGSFAWLLEADTVGLATAANDTASILANAMGTTLGTATIPDINTLGSIVFDAIGPAITLLASNIPLFGLGDDVLGGGLYIGIGVKGTLAGIVNAAIGTTALSFDIPVVDVPPNIDHGGFYTMAGAKDFTGQSFSGGGGTHTYDFRASLNGA
jgi:hypothetical protein